MLCTLVMLFLYCLSMVTAKWEAFSANGSMCKLVGFVIQFSQMSAFFWLSAIGHNMWRKFSQQKIPVSRNRQLGFMDKHFKWYALYAWGCPMICTIVTLIMQNMPGNETKDTNVVYPKMGEKGCTLEPEWAKFYYFHLINTPVVVSTWFSESQ